MMLTVDALEISLARRGGPVAVLRDVTFELPRGGTLGIVGESGSGKSMLALAIIGLLPAVARPAGQVRFDGIELLGLDEPSLCRIRGNRIGMVFQEPMTALNPAHRVGHQVAESLVLHRGLSRSAAAAEALRLFDRVRIPEASRRVAAYPHELSGGQRQRVGIAIALACGPDLLIADEPTTALDVTVQAEILGLLADLVEEESMGLLLISHDLGVIGEMTRDLLVLYAGTVVERGPTASIVENPAHPYTRGLFDALPGLQPGTLPPSGIPGQIPDPASRPPGCVFSDRCPHAIAACQAAIPGLVPLGPGRAARCIRGGGL